MVCRLHTQMHLSTAHREEEVPATQNFGQIRGIAETVDHNKDVPSDSLILFAHIVPKKAKKY